MRLLAACPLDTGVGALSHRLNTSLFQRLACARMLRLLATARLRRGAALSEDTIKNSIDDLRSAYY